MTSDTLEGKLGSAPSIVKKLADSYQEAKQDWSNIDTNYMKMIGTIGSYLSSKGRANLTPEDLKDSEMIKYKKNFINESFKKLGITGDKLEFWAGEPTGLTMKDIDQMLLEYGPLQAGHQQINENKKLQEVKNKYVNMTMDQAVPMDRAFKSDVFDAIGLSDAFNPVRSQGVLPYQQLGQFAQMATDDKFDKDTMANIVNETALKFYKTGDQNIRNIFTDAKLYELDEAYSKAS